MKSVKRWMCGALLLLATVAGCCPTCPREFTSVSNDFAFPFCRVASDNGTSTIKSLCSGTLVDRNDDLGLVLTCFHCTRHGGPYHVRFCNGTEYAAKLIRESSQHDLAALVITRPNVQPVPCGAYDGQGVYRAYGFGGNGELSCVQGRVVRHYGEIGSTGHQYVGIEGKPISGDSGSGTVNENNEFVGVLWGHNGRDGLITMGTPVSDFMRGLVADGLWNPSSTFTPGGSPVRGRSPAFRNEFSVVNEGYAADGKSRTIVDEAGQQVVATLCSNEVQTGLLGGLPQPGCFGGRCPPRDPGPSSPNAPGRIPIRSPFDMTPPEKIETPIGDVYAEREVFVLLGVAAAVGIVAAAVRYANENNS